MDTSQERIDSFNKYALIGFSISIELTQLLFVLIPFVGLFLAILPAIIGRIILWVWFQKLNVGFADTSNRFMVNTAISFAEFLPLINILPFWTIGTIVIIHQVKKEDAKKYSI